MPWGWLCGGRVTGGSCHHRLCFVKFSVPCCCSADVSLMRPASLPGLRAPRLCCVQSLSRASSVCLSDVGYADCIFIFVMLPWFTVSLLTTGYCSRLFCSFANKVALTKADLQGREGSCSHFTPWTERCPVSPLVSFLQRLSNCRSSSTAAVVGRGLNRVFF